MAKKDTFTAYKKPFDSSEFFEVSKSILEKEIGDLTGEKEKLQKQIKDLESKEAQPPEENKEEKKVEEIKKLKNDIDTFKAQKEELQTRIEELQAA